MKPLRSFVFAFRGIRYAIKSQRNIKIHFAAAIGALGAGYYFSITKLEWIILLILIGLVVSLELINTAVEQLVDLRSPEFDERAGRIKDIAAGAVLFFSTIALLVGLIVFWKYIVV